MEKLRRCYWLNTNQSENAFLHIEDHLDAHWSKPASTSSMYILRDQQLLDCYFQSIEYKLDQAFIALLQTEIKKRNLQLTETVSV
jgi:hypothetical protein